MNNTSLNINFFKQPIIKICKNGSLKSFNDSFKNLVDSFRKDYENKPKLIKDGSVLILNKRHFVLEQLHHEDEFQNWFSLVDKTDFLLQKNENNKLAKDQKFNHKLSTIGEMTAGIAHDLNNPLGIITSNTDILDFLWDELNEELVEKNIYSTLSEESQESINDFKESINSIKEASQRAASIVDGMRIFSRKGQDKAEKVNLSKMIENSINFCKGNLSQYNIDIKFNANNLENANIIAEEVHLYQVFVNLINNARDAVSDLDNLQKWIKINLKKEDENIIVEIIDGGNGIPLEIQNKIMNPFFTTKKVGKGTGLGLSICKKILTEQSANFFIDNENQNTSFIIKFKES